MTTNRLRHLKREHLKSWGKGFVQIWKTGNAPAMVVAPSFGHGLLQRIWPRCVPYFHWKIYHMTDLKPMKVKVKATLGLITNCAIVCGILTINVGVSSLSDAVILIQSRVNFLVIEEFGETIRETDRKAVPNISKLFDWMKTADWKCLDCTVQIKFWCRWLEMMKSPLI